MPTCIDTDDKNVETKGTCRIDGLDYVDFCVNGKVKEYYCGQTTCMATLVDCETYCRDEYGEGYEGKCVSGACKCELKQVNETTTTTVEERKVTGKFAAPTQLMIIVAASSIAFAFVILKKLGMW